MTANDSSAVGGGTQVVLTEIQATSSFTGPLPRPDVLAEFEAAHTGAAGKIIEYADRQQAHRHEMERQYVGLDLQTVTDESRYRARGQIFGFSLVVLVLLIGGGLVAIGKELTGLTALLTAAGAVIGGSVWNRVEARRDREAEEKKRIEASRQQELPLP